MLAFVRGRLSRAFDLVETRLGEAEYFAGSAFTAADIIMVFSLTTMRIFLPLDVAPYPTFLLICSVLARAARIRRQCRRAIPEWPRC